MLTTSFRRRPVCRTARSCTGWQPGWLRRPPGGRARTACGGAHSRVEDGVRSHFFRYAPSRLELLAYGPGMVYNLSVDRRRLALLPPFGAAFAVAAARHARGADVVHGHWLPAGMVARVDAAAVRDDRPRLRSGAGASASRHWCARPSPPRHDRRQRGHAPRALDARAERRHPRRRRRAASSSRPGPTTMRRRAGCCSSAAWST